MWGFSKKLARTQLTLRNIDKDITLPYGHRTFFL